ncbi:MAG: polyphosphate polymerase domain-containing protein [Bacilli bacterium]|nr:polyphosphate polymerase domain-containing protein [Bacilli bacterium]
MAQEIIAVMRRYEVKYRLNKEQVAFIREKLLGHMEEDQYGLTTICSLYYDTPSLQLIRRSVEKPLFKEKIRLRSYGVAKPGSTLFLEMKRKHEGIVYKRRVATKKEQVEGFFARGEELGGTQISAELQQFRKSHEGLAPRFFIAYDRVAYFEKDGDLRVTLDLNPRYRTYDLDLSSSSEGASLLGEGEAILEVKAQHAIPLWLSAILSEGKIYPTSFSKVGTAYQREMAVPHILPGHAKANANYKGGNAYGLAV